MYMYNNFSSKKTKKVISALLASALVVTSGPITADAATAKVVGIKKTFTVSASATNKVTGLSKAEKKVVKVTKKGKKFTIKGLKAGKATFKIGKKSYIVKVGATTVKAAKTKLTLTKGKSATLKFTTKSGNGDTLTFKASNKNVTLAKKSAKIAKSAASVKATAKKAGKTTITATSKATGKKATVTVTVKNAAKPATTTPGASNTPVATATGSATNTPEATATATATASGSATNTPDVTATPVATATGTATATPVATGSATNTPEATEVPTEAPTKAPEVVTGGTITVTTNVSGASIKVVSGTTVVATAKTDVATSATISNIPAGTYIVEVSKAGYDTTTTTVVVNGDVTANVTLKEEDKSVSITGVTYVTEDGSKAKLEGATIGQNADIVVTFSGKIAATSANLNSVKIYKGSVLAVVNEVSVSKDRKSITINHATLDDAADYTLNLAGIQSEAGIEVAKTTVAFKTGSDLVVKSFSVNADVNDSNTNASGHNNQRVIKTTMSDLAKEALEANDTLELTLNRAIDATSIDTDKITLTRIEANGVTVKDKLNIAGIKVKGLSADDAKVLEITLGANYFNTNNDIIVLSVDGLKDLQGKSLATTTYQFVVDQGRVSMSVDGPNGVTLTNQPYYYGLTGITKADGSVLPGFRMTLKFGVPVKESTVDKDSVKLQKVDTTGSVEAYTDVETDIRFDSTGKIATVTPKKELDKDATYRLITNTNIKSIYGKPVAETVNTKFTTIDSVGPVVKSTTPETGKTDVKVGQKYEVVFQMDKASYFGTLASVPEDFSATLASSSTNNGAQVYVYNATDGVYVTTNVTAEKDLAAKTITVKFDESVLKKNKTYIVGLVGKDGSEDSARGVIEDVHGNPLEASYQMQFTTEGVDSVAPTISQITVGDAKTGTVVKNKATNLSAAATSIYNIEFSEKLDIRTASIKLEKYAPSTQTWGTAAPIAADTDSVLTSGEYLKSTYRDTFDYLQIKGDTFSNNALNRLTISGIKDADGNVMDDAQFLLTFGNGPTLVTTAASASTQINNGGGYAAGATALAVDSNTDFAANDFVAVDLENGNKFVSSLASTTTNNLVLKDSLPSSVADDAAVTKLPTTVNGVSGIDKSASIYVVLTGVNVNCKIDVDTIDTANVILKDVDGNVVDATLKVTKSNDGVNACITITPKKDLAADTQYRVYIDGVKDTAGNVISDKKFAFKTAGETVTPDVKFVNITDDDLFTTYDRDSAIVLEFSGDLVKTGEGTNAASKAGNYTLREVGGSTIAVKPVVDGKKVTLYPDTVLAANKTYTLTVADTITVGGNALSTNKKVDNVLTFKTSNQENSSVHGSLGINKATFNSTTKVLKLTFDRPLTSTQTTIDNSYFNLTAGSLGALVGTNAVISSDGLTLSMVVNTDNSAIIAGTTKIEVAAEKNITYVASTANTNVDKVAVTIEAE